MTREESDELLQKHADILKEHFENVIIFANWQEEDESGEVITRNRASSNGNMFACYGQVRHWVCAQESDFRFYQENQEY